MKAFYADRCIYCNSIEQRTREHVVPKAWGGNIVIQEASCKKCQELINNEIENTLSRETYMLLRSMNKIKSTTGYDDAVVMKFFNIKDGPVFKKNINLTEVPLSVIIPYFSCPNFYKENIDNWPAKQAGRVVLKISRVFEDREYDKRWRELFQKNNFKHGTLETSGIRPDGFIKFLYKVSIGLGWIIDPALVEKSKLRQRMFGNFNIENITDLLSAPAFGNEKINYFRGNVFNKTVEDDNHIFCSMRFFSNLFPEYYCDFGIFPDYKVNRIFEC